DRVRRPHRGQDVALDVELPGDERLAEAERGRAEENAAEDLARAEHHREGALAFADAHRRPVPEAEAERDRHRREDATQEACSAPDAAAERSVGIPSRRHASGLSRNGSDMKVPSSAPCDLQIKPCPRYFPPRWGARP